MQGKKATGHC